MNHWKKRKLTLLGKITVLKTFIVSSLNHLFSSVISLRKIFISHLNNKMYSLICDNKPDKISRKQMMNTHLHGGLKMMDIEEFMKSQNIVWIKRLIKNPNSPYANSFSTSISFDSLYTMGSLWSKNMAAKISNPFWREVLLAWNNLIQIPYKKMKPYLALYGTIHKSPLNLNSYQTGIMQEYMHR